MVKTILIAILTCALSQLYSFTMTISLVFLILQRYKIFDFLLFRVFRVGYCHQSFTSCVDQMSFKWSF